MIKRIILENYIPLMKSGITYVELHPHHIVNLLIARNGVGKTSILKELNSSPPENGDYAKTGGRKLIERVVGSNVYLLDSRTALGNGHSFKLNGKELNPNGTFLAQKELVKKHLKEDSNLARVFSGLSVLDRLSGMSPGRRKETIMDIYPNNVDYALKVYDKLKQERNDLKGAIKNQISRYTEENRKLSVINECGVEELERRVQALDKDLRESLLVRGGLEHATIDPALQSNVIKFNQLVDKLVVNRLGGFNHSREEIVNLIEQNETILDMYKQQAGVSSTIISEHAGCLEGLEEFLANPEVFKTQGDTLTKSLDEVQNEIDLRTKHLNTRPVFDNPGYTFEGLNDLEPRLRPYLYRVTQASHENLSGNGYKKALDEHETLSNQVRHDITSLGDHKHRLQHYENADVVDCPDCSKQFKVGISPADILNLKNLIKATEQRIQKGEERLVVLKNLIENDADWFMSMNQLYQFVRENGHVIELSQLIKEYNIGKDPSEPLLNALTLFTEREKYLHDKKVLLEEQNLLETRIGLLDRNNVLMVAEYIASVEAELSIDNQNIDNSRAKLYTLKGILNDMDRYTNDVETLNKLRVEILESFTKEAQVKLRGKVDNRINLLSDEKDSHLSSIIKSRSLTAVVESISGDIDRLKRRQLIVETLMDGLCPNKGIIGKLMGDFIKSLCGNANALLKAIYSEPLYIMPCAKSNGDLTYKFPVIVGEGEPVPDVKHCSAGQCDLIDWVWRVVLMGYHPRDWPLIMDEVGINLDEINRNRFFNFVNDYTRNKNNRQVFIVSHYINQTRVFADANILGIKYEGLTLPGVPSPLTKIA